MHSVLSELNLLVQSLGNMLLRPFEVLVPREHKAECLQRGFNSLATEQVNGKEKLCSAATQNRSFSSDSNTSEKNDASDTCPTSVSETCAHGQCPTEDSMQVVRGWCVFPCVFLTLAFPAIRWRFITEVHPGWHNETREPYSDQQNYFKREIWPLGFVRRSWMTGSSRLHG